MLESVVGPTMTKGESVDLETHHNEKISASLKRRQRMNSSFGRNNVDKEKTANDTTRSFQQEEERDDQTSRQVHSGTTRKNVQTRHGYHDDTVVRPIPLRAKKRSTRSNTRKVVTAANTDVFEQLHCCSQSKNAEGKKRREEIRRRSEERARRRYGVSQRTYGTISSERGSRLYYEGMMYKAQVERRVAEKAMELEIQFQTKLYLQQMLEYYFKMQQDEMFQ